MPPTGVWMSSLFGGLLLLAAMRELSCLQPGAKLQLSQSGLNYAAKVAVDIVATKIKDQKLPEQSGIAKLTVGEVDYLMNDVSIQSFTHPSSKVTVNAGTGVTWTLSNADISATGSWSYNYSHWFTKFSDSGRFDLTINGGSFELSVTLGSDTDGRPTIAVLGCSSTITKVNIKFSSGASWLYRLFTGFVEKHVKTALEKIVCDTATKTINDNGAKQLATLKTSITLANEFVIDYRLLEKPIFERGYIQSSHKGEVFHVGDLGEAPFSARSISTQTPNRMFTVIISEYVVNTLGHVLQQQDYLSYVLTKDDLPSKNRQFFSTSCKSGCVGALFPEVASRYPNSFIALEMRSTVRPTLNISKQSVMGNIQGEVDVIVRQPDGKTNNLFSLRVTLRCSLTAGIRNNSIIGTVTRFTPSTSLINSNMKDISERSLNRLLTVATNNFIVPKLNEVGQRGLAIPSFDYVDIVDPSVTLIDGALVAAADVRYTP